jgi:hypothetical protein
VTPPLGVHLLSVEDGLCAHYLIRLLDGSPNQNEIEYLKELLNCRFI